MGGWVGVTRESGRSRSNMEDDSGPSLGTTARSPRGKDGLANEKDAGPNQNGREKRRQNPYSTMSGQSQKQGFSLLFRVKWTPTSLIREVWCLDLWGATPHIHTRVAQNFF